MNIETKQQQQQQHQQKHQKHQKQYKQQQSSQHQHHAHCSYDKDIVCDDAQMHKPMHQHHSHQPHSKSYQQCEKSKINENLQHHQQQLPHQNRSKQSKEKPQTPSLSHRHHQHQSQSQSQSQTQRKYSHSHSPHHSRHTSPHSHHSHSLHSSPHQSHQHVNDSTGGGSGGIEASYQSPTRTNHFTQRPSEQTHGHHHHHHRQRNRRNHSHHTNGNGSGGGSGGGSGNSSFHGPHGHSHNTQDRSSSRQHNSRCSRRHRSATDISSVSLNTCHNESCIDREVQEIFVRKSCCSSSRTELAQCFAEDLYSSSRRPSSCCTSSDYCYQTDSTSLYGSRSSLSRNNSIKSASVSIQKKRALHQRQPSYTSISLHGVQSSQSSNRHQQHGSLTSVFDRQKSKSTEAKNGEHLGGGKVVLSPSKVTIERQTSKNSRSQDLPNYLRSPSPPIRWSFFADEKVKSEVNMKKNEDRERPKTSQPRKPCRQSKQGQTFSKDERSSITPGTARKRRTTEFSGDLEESSTTVLFHQEGESFNNCCNNYIQCNSYLDQDLQITSEDIHQYLSKGTHSEGDILNNSKTYPFQPSNALEFHYKNNFANNNAIETGTGTGTNSTAEFTVGAEGILTANGDRSKNSFFYRNSSKETNLNQNAGENSRACQPSNINLSSSTNNINVMVDSSATAAGIERPTNTNEVKFINTASRMATMTDETHHSVFTPYECTNVSSNSYFNKTLGIDELPKELEVTAIATKSKSAAECSGTEGSSTDGQHSSPLPSPVQTGVSFESFDAPSDHNLISQRGSGQFSSPTPCSPLSPSSPACSSLSVSVNHAPSTYVVKPTQHYQPHHYSYSCEPDHPTQSRGHHHHHHHHHSPASTIQRAHHTHSHEPDEHHHHHHHHDHTNDSFKLSNAFKRVRKRARKYTDFLRKK